MSHRMLYKHPGPLDLHGGKFDALVVPDAEVDAALEAGWFKTTDEAKAATEAAKQADADDLVGLPKEAPKVKGKK